MAVKFVIVVLLNIVYFVTCEYKHSFNDVQYSNKDIYELQEDALLLVPDIISKYGYPVEIHTVVTEDGYVLTLHRIPHGRHSPASPDKPPVLIQHGFIANSMDSVIAGPDEAISYYLADSGFDVWLGNTRGNRYSHQHISLERGSRGYWDFTFSEVGYYDIPAIVDYILYKTQQEKLFYIGHSRGTTAFYIMCSERPEYNNKIRLMMSLAPISYMSNIPSPIFQILSRMRNTFERVLTSIGLFQYTPNRDLFAELGQALCSDASPTQPFCTTVSFMLSGFDFKNMNSSLFPVMLGHVPDSLSIKELVHYGQLVVSGRFEKFDYGYAKNQIIYESPRPPSYNLTAITAPVALFISTNDWQSSTIDADRLFRKLGNPIGKYVLENSPNHFSYYYGTNMRKFIYSKLSRLMNNF